MWGKAADALEALTTRTIRTECDGIPFSIANAPLKKVLNWIAVEVSTSFKPESPWGWPTHVQVEPSALCNLRCVLCPVTNGIVRSSPLGHMHPDMFRSLIDQMADYLLLVLLWDWGEPFLNPDIYDMIAHAKRRNLTVISSTNGHPFARTDNAAKVVSSGLDALIVSVDGVTQATYERFRQGGDLTAVLDGVRNLVAEKKAAGSANPLLNLRLLVTRDNEHELADLAHLGRDLGVDVVSLKTINPYLGHSSGGLSPEQRLAFLPQTPELRRFRIDPKGTGFERVAPACKNLWNSPAVHLRRHRLLLLVRP